MLTPCRTELISEQWKKLGYKFIPQWGVGLTRCCRKLCRPFQGSRVWIGTTLRDPWPSKPGSRAPCRDRHAHRREASSPCRNTGTHDLLDLAGWLCRRGLQLQRCDSLSYLWMPLRFKITNSQIWKGFQSCALGPLSTCEGAEANAHDPLQVERMMCLAVLRPGSFSEVPQRACAGHTRNLAQATFVPSLVSKYTSVTDRAALAHRAAHVGREKDVC